MKMIDGIPQIVEGMSYFAHLQKPVPDYTEKQNPGAGKYGWEINLAVSDDVFKAFKEAGYNVGMKQAGQSKYTPDPVITFYRYHLDYNQRENSSPIVVDTEKEPFGDMIGNGSRVAVQWSPMVYGKGKFKRPILQAVQVLDLIEIGSYPDSTKEVEVAF